MEVVCIFSIPILSCASKETCILGTRRDPSPTEETIVSELRRDTNYMTCLCTVGKNFLLLSHRKLGLD